MLQYLVHMGASDGAPRCFSFSNEDIVLIREAREGKPFDLENYVAYLASDRTLTLSRRPAHVDAAVVDYAAICRKLAEAEIEAIEYCF